MAQTLANDGSTNLNSTGSGIKLRANSSGVPMSHDDVDTNFENLRAKINEVIGEVGTNTSKLSGIATGANNYSLPLATHTVRGGIELFSNTDQSVAANSVSTTASRTYGIQLNSANQAVVNVPWTNTTYSSASSSNPGLSKLGSNTQQNTSANSVTSTVSRTYAVQHNSADQLVVNVPWSNTNTTYSTATSGTAGLVKIGYSENGKNYPVELASGKMYVNVPWVNTDTNTTYTAGTGISISGTTISATGGAGVSLEGIDTGWARSLAISGGESGDPDSGTIETAGASRTVATGNLYVVNDESILRVYINQNSGVDIGSGYDNTGATGNGSGIAGFRGIIRDNHDSRARAIPVKFKNFGQAEKYINFYHSTVNNIQVFLGSDVTETLYAQDRPSSNNGSTIIQTQDSRNWEFFGVKNSMSDPSVPRWSITYKTGDNFRNNLIDTSGNVRFSNIQFDITSPKDWLGGTRGGYLRLDGYIGVRVNGNFRYGIWRAGESGFLYDFSIGDYIKTGTSANTSTLYQYDIALNSTCYQHPAGTQGHGGNAYRVDGNFGVAKIGPNATFLLDAYNVPHTGSDDSQVPGWPGSDGSLYTGASIADTSRDFGNGSEEFHQAQGPYCVYVGSNKNYEPVTETNKVPAFLFNGTGGTVGFAHRTPDYLDADPIPYNRFRYTPVIGNVDWAYAGGNIPSFSGSTSTGVAQASLQWDPQAYGFTAIQAAMINFGATVERPIRREHIGTAGAKFRSFNFRKAGHEHGGPGFGGSSSSSTFPTVSSYSANENSKITNW